MIFQWVAPFAEFSFIFNRIYCMIINIVAFVLKFQMEITTKIGVNVCLYVFSKMKMKGFS